MNARQKQKQLKKKIAALESDNKLMRNIISNSPKMQELYDLYNKPLNVYTSPLDFQQYEVKRRYDDSSQIAFYKEEIKRELRSVIDDHIQYNIDRESYPPFISGRVFVGRYI